jgi:ATP-dependent Clp protease, protease subunit
MRKFMTDNVTSPEKNKNTEASAFDLNSKNYAEPKYNIEQAQIDDRVIHLEGSIDAKMASYVTQALLHLNKINSQPIQLYINSPGGSVIDGFAIINIMNDIDAPVYTCAKGLAASMGALLLAAGEKGHRYALPDSVIMIHEGSNSSQGTSSNFKSYAKFSEKLDERADKFLAKVTGKTLKQIQKDTLVDLWMFSEDALNYGIIDEIKKSSKN